MKFAPLFLCLLSVGSQAKLFGQCFDDNLRGSYGYLATLGVGTATGTGTGTATPTFSSTPLGTLLSGIAGSTATGAGSTLYFDGLGRVFASSSSGRFAQNITSQMVGSYSVSSDCTVKVNLYDSFTDTATPTSPNNPSLVGLIARGGDEIYLTQLAPVNTGTTAPTGNAALAQRTTIRLVRFSDSYNAGCTSSSLRGPYGLIGEGFSTVGPTTTTTTTTGGTTTTTVTNSTIAPYYSTFLATVNFDGTGNLTNRQVNGTSSLATFQFRGTYTINADCSGTMSITQQPAPAAGTTDTSTFTTLRFVVTPQSGFVDSSGQVTSQPVQNLRPGLYFNVANANQIVSGVGVPQ